MLSSMHVPFLFYSSSMEVTSTKRGRFMVFAVLCPGASECLTGIYAVVPEECFNPS